MKIIRKVCILLAFSAFIAILLTGCSYNQSARISLDITVKRNQKVDASFLCAVLQEMAEYQFFESEDLRNMKERGWDYRLYNQDGYLGYVFTIEDVELSSLISAVDGVETGLGGLNGDTLSISKEGMNYTFRAQLFDEDTASTFELYKTDFLTYDGFVNVILRLPEKPTSSNATFVSDDGKTLTWDLLNVGADQQMRAEFQLIPTYYIFILIALGMTIIICLLIATILRVVRKKEEAKIAAAQAKAKKKAEALAAAEAQKKAAAVAQTKKKALAAAQAAANRKAAANNRTNPPK